MTTTGWRFGLVGFLVYFAAGFAGAADSAPSAGAPVLVELFTSEGCSSCPPADSLLGKLDRLQPVPGAQAIVLSEHVDYWNHDGWKDAYSSSFYTDRQKDYVSRLGAKEAYTPQMVVDGVAQLNGSNGPAVLAAVEKARGDVKVPVRISGVGLDGRTLKLHVVVDGLPEDSKAKKADVVVAVALNHAESHVSAGENKGKDIQNVAGGGRIKKGGVGGLASDCVCAGGRWRRGGGGGFGGEGVGRVAGGRCQVYGRS